MAQNKASVALRAWIKESTWTQMTLSAELGVSQTTVSAWLAGTAEPRAVAAAKLEALSGIPVADWGKAAE